MILFLLGPSGIGKTSVTTALRMEMEPPEVIELDAAIRTLNPTAYFACGTSPTGDSVFWHGAERLIVDLEQQPHQRNTIIDVGAGTLRAEFAYPFFRERRSRIIVLYDDAANVFKRLKENRPNTPHQSVDGLRSAEYSENHMKCYQLGMMCDVTGLNVSDASKKFSAIYHSVVSSLIV